MTEDFSRILTMLRKERNISQKEAADALGVSQALLSHYERGRRGCNLEFVIKASDYYGVSCDYILGRSPEKSGARITAEDIPEGDELKDNVLSRGAKGSVVATLNKKLIANSINVLYDILIKSGSKQLITTASHYLMLAVYKVFRHIYRANPKNINEMFAVREPQFQGYSSAALQICEADLQAILSGRDPKTQEKLTDINVPEISPEILSEAYPLYFSSVMNVIQYAESRMNLK
ncbi:MAG: helix-turn-helix transcriptional regulator [Oscillospiraceae bacterium]|nr:helix-turn-helix transcriptional regulator [Oscillospiraceae bacterium]